MTYNIALVFTPKLGTFTSVDFCSLCVFVVCELWDFLGGCWGFFGGGFFSLFFFFFFGCLFVDLFLFVYLFRYSAAFRCNCFKLSFCFTKKHEHTINRFFKVFITLPPTHTYTH